MDTVTMEKVFGKHRRLRFVSNGEFRGSYVSDDRWSWQQAKAVRDDCYRGLQQFMKSEK